MEKNNYFHTVFRNETASFFQRAERRERESVCEEWLCVHYKPSDVILLVICPETRGEILLRCRCSVKLYTAGKILLMCRILWKIPKSVFLPTELEGEREERTLKYV